MRRLRNSFRRKRRNSLRSNSLRFFSPKSIPTLFASKLRPDFLSHRIPAKCTILIIHRNNLHCSSESIPTLFASKLRPDFFVPSNPCKMHDSDSSEQSSLFAEIHSYTFRPKTKAGFFCLIESLQKARFWFIGTIFIVRQNLFLHFSHQNRGRNLLSF